MHGNVITHTQAAEVSLVGNEIQSQSKENMVHMPPFGRILELQIIIANFHIRIE